MALKKISTVDQSLLCSSIYVNNFKRVIEELVYNSLDAASTSIAIRVSLREFYIQVLDNGNGISEDNLSLLGQKFATSKYVDITTLRSAPDKYGFKGLSLASIIEVSESIVISSRHENSNESWMKTFYNGKEKEICKTLLRPSKGTTVQINGFLYNLNIRRKSLHPHTELQNIKTALQQLSLVHCNVSFSLRDDFKNDIIFQINKKRTVYDTLHDVFQINEKDVQELQVEKNKYKVKAFIGKITVESNIDYQWIYINGKFIYKSILHKKLNDSFIKRIRNSRKNKHLYEDEYNYFNTNIPFYFIFITCPNYDFDITYNSEKSSVEFKDGKEINKIIEKLVQFYDKGPITAMKAINKLDNDEIKCDTRAEIKQIMERILNNKNKKSRISKLQNGVMGKILKRYRKKQRGVSQKNILKKKIEDNDLSPPRDFSNVSNVKTDNLIKKSNRLNTFNGSLPKDINNKVTKPEFPKIKKRKTQVKTYKKKPYVKDALNENVKTPTPTETVIKQYEYLQRRATLPEKNNSREHKSKKHTMYTETSSWKGIELKDAYDNKQHNLDDRKVIKSYDILKAVIPSQYNMKKNYESTRIEDRMVKKSYEILKAVITSQNNLKQNNNIPINFRKHTYERKTNYASNKTLIPLTTYESHNYENISTTNSFISKYSRENYLFNKQFPPIFKKVANLVKNNPKSKNNVLKNNLLKSDKESQEWSYTIQLADSHQIINSKTNQFETIACNKRNFPKCINATSINFENTYTIEGIMQSSQNNDNNNLNKSYFLQMCNTLSPCNNLRETQVSIMPEVAGKSFEKENFVVPKPETMTVNTDVMTSIEDPVHYCEPILEDPSFNELREIENEFDKSFFSRNRVELSNFDIVQDVNTCVKGNIEEIVECELDNHIQNIKTHENKIQLFKSDKKLDNDANYNFHLKSRYHFMPKGMSPIANNEYEQHNTYKSTGNHEYYKDMIYKNFANYVILNTDIYEPEVQNVKYQFSKHMEKRNSELKKQNADLIFDSSSLRQAKVFGQVDRKFIVSSLNGRSALTGNTCEFIVLFDQHAVDERIRLESNLSDYIEENSWNSIVTEPVSIALNKDDYFYFINYKDKLMKFGLKWSFTSDNEILLNALPKAIIGKNPRKVEIVMKAVNKLISEQIKAIKSLKGNVPLYPKSIMKLVFSEACRYAIKFGDKLSNSECTNMINSLSGCKTPFQCAHGRPVMAVLMELINNNQSYKVNLETIKRFKKCMDSIKKPKIIE